VDDHCRGVQLVLTAGQGGQVYHINGDAELTNLELTQALLRACGAGPELIQYVPDRKGHDRRYALNDDRLRALGYRPRIPFAAGLAGTVDWYRAHRAWWEPLRPALPTAAAACVTDGPARGKTSPPTATAARPGRRGCR
jgi:dTDP-glucose 4,6-dehydratase